MPSFEERMPFSQSRALAFAQYTLTALVRENNGKILTISRHELARVLDVEKLWDKHIDVISAEATKYDVGTANLGSRIAFVGLEQNSNVQAIDVKDAKEITDKFEHIYGSKAADDMWENGEYRLKPKMKKASKNI
jgi:hypothetical protein